MGSFGKAVAVVVLAPAALSACATYNLTKPPPAQSNPIALVFSSTGPSGWSDLPIGVYRVPDSSVIVSGAHRGSGVGGMFGLVGVLAQDAIETGAAAHAVNNGQDALRINLAPQAEAVTQKLLASGKFGQGFTTAAAAGQPVLTVDPYVVLTFTNETDARPYVVLKATLKTGQAAQWTTRYTASSGKPLAVMGENSLTANGGKLLNDAVAQNLESAITVMLDDMTNRRPRDEAKLIYAETGYPYMHQRIGVTGYEVSEDDHEIVFVPKIGDAAVFAGVHVIDKAVTTYRPPTKDDSFKMLDDGK